MEQMVQGQCPACRKPINLWTTSDLANFYLEQGKPMFDEDSDLESGLDSDLNWDDFHHIIKASMASSSDNLFWLGLAVMLTFNRPHPKMRALIGEVQQHVEMISKTNVVLSPTNKQQASLIIKQLDTFLATSLNLNYIYDISDTEVELYKDVLFSLKASIGDLV